MPTPRVAGTGRLLGEVALAGVALGLVAGIVWPALAPDIQGEVTLSGVTVPTVEARRQFGVDGWFAVAAVIGGLLLGVVFFARHRRRPVTTLVALTVAGLIATAVQWRVGILLGPGPVEDRSAALPAGSAISMPLELNAPAVLVVWPIGAVVGALLVAAFLDDRESWSARLSRRGRSGQSSPPSAG